MAMKEQKTGKLQETGMEPEWNGIESESDQSGIESEGDRRLEWNCKETRDRNGIEKRPGTGRKKLGYEVTGKEPVIVKEKS